VVLSNNNNNLISTSTVQLRFRNLEQFVRNNKISEQVCCHGVIRNDSLTPGVAGYITFDEITWRLRITQS
jgi:hypothetical protein